MIKGSWQKLEIELLIELFRQGRREKEIARILDRSTSSVSKMIDRLGLRKKHPKKEREANRSIFKCLRVEKVEVAPRDICQSIEIPINIELVNGQGGKSTWVTFPEVINWLEGQGHIVRRSSQKKQIFILGGTYMTDGQVLLFCNRLRFALGLAVMCVPGITHVDK